MKFTYEGETLDSELLMFDAKQQAYVDLLEAAVSENYHIEDKPESVEIMSEAIEAFGARTQRDVAIEECSELIKALCKINRFPLSDNRSSVVEEIGDVQIVLKQLKMMFDCNDEVEDAIQWKLCRLKKRIEKAKGNMESL